MTVNFKNSAGTDLDNLFYTDNGNAGTLGFKNSSGTDLGNRYTNKSTLGYSVGYKNSAGTDIGYLRGNLTAPSSIDVNYEYQYCCRPYQSDWEGRCTVVSYYWHEYQATLTFDSVVETVTYYNNAGSVSSGFGTTYEDYSVASSKTYTINGTKANCFYARSTTGSCYVNPTITVTATNAAGSTEFSFRFNSGSTSDNCYWRQSNCTPSYGGG